MTRHEKFIISIKNMGKTTDVLAYSYRDAINYLKLVDDINTDIRIYSQDERLVYSKLYQRPHPSNQQAHGQQAHVHYAYHHNLVTGEEYVEIHEGDNDDDDSYA